ncbi:MAG: glycosyltransferase family 2 protein [Selenomonadaceae bacterium]|nr:glycosyltransferase family 2 protein [Selenomonadaceae bacterium]
MELPAISVIIPMYNAERYIGECLDSLLAQTFQDFEVIVVDDCSTDNSIATVKNYSKKFGGRLKIASMKKNSGYAGFPRNKGIELSRGEYISFIDNDDAFTPTALEKLYSVAEDFDADVVACEKYYPIFDKDWHNAEAHAKAKIASYKRGNFVDKPTLLENDLEKRTIAFSQRNFIWNVWSQLFKRDFIIKNEIKMPNFQTEDLVFTICSYAVAERYVVVPDVINYYRIREDSLIFEKVSPDKLLHKWVRGLIIGFKHIDEFLSTQKDFAERGDLKYMLLNLFAQEMLKYLNNIYAQIPIHALDSILRNEFENRNVNALMPFIFSLMNVYRLQLGQSNQKISQLNQYAVNAQKRIAELESEVNRMKNKE